LWHCFFTATTIWRFLLAYFVWMSFIAQTALKVIDSPAATSRVRTANLLRQISSDFLAFVMIVPIWKTLPKQLFPPISTVTELKKFLDRTTITLVLSEKRCWNAVLFQKETACDGMCSLLTIVKQMLVFRKGTLWIWAWSMFLWQNNVQDAKIIPLLLYLLNIMQFFNHTTHDQIKYDLCCQNLPAEKY